MIFYFLSNWLWTQTKTIYRKWESTLIETLNLFNFFQICMSIWVFIFIAVRRTSSSPSKYIHSDGQTDNLDENVIRKAVIAWFVPVPDCASCLSICQLCSGSLFTYHIRSVNKYKSIFKWYENTINESFLICLGKKQQLGNIWQIILATAW